MKYVYEERLEIGRRIYDDELTKFEAAEEYRISINCARDYMRLYRDHYKLPPKNVKVLDDTGLTEEIRKLSEKYASMSREELIKELLDAKTELIRLKRGKKE